MSMQILQPIRCLISIVALGSTLSSVGNAQQEWHYPIDVEVGDDEAIYIVDRQLPGLWSLKEGHSEVFVQASKKFRTPLNAIRCVYVTSDGTLYVGDSAAREVFRVDAEGRLTQLTAPDPVVRDTLLTEDLEFTPDNFGLIGIPMAIAANSQGELFVTDTDLQRVWKVSAEGGEPEEFLLVSGPRGIVVDDEDHVWVLSLQAPQLQRVSPEGEVEVIVSDLTFDFPHQVELGPDGTAYVSDGYAKAIWKVTRDGAAEKWISGAPLDNPVGISWRGEDLLIADSRANALFSAAADGTLTRVYPVESE